MMTIKEICGIDAVLLRELTPGVFSVDNGVSLTPLQATQVVPASLSGAAGFQAIPFPGTTFLTDAGIGAYTLAAPVTGGPGTGDDGKTVTIISSTAFAHTVTLPAGKLNGTLHLLTFAGAVGNNVSLKAFGGVWYTSGSPSGVTAS